MGFQCFVFCQNAYIQILQRTTTVYFMLLVDGWGLLNQDGSGVLWLWACIDLPCLVAI